MIPLNVVLTCPLNPPITPPFHSYKSQISFNAITCLYYKLTPHYFPHLILLYLCDLFPTILCLVASTPPKWAPYFLLTEWLSWLSLKLLIHILWLFQNRTLFSQMSAWLTLLDPCSCAALCFVAQACLTLRPHGLQPIRLLWPWGFSRQEHWSGLPCPPPGDLTNPGVEPGSPVL